MVDGGASEELVAFFRGAFDVQTAARKIALTIEAAAADLRRRVPAALMRRVHKIVVDVARQPAASSSAAVVSQGGDGSTPHDAKLQAPDKKRGKKRARQVVERLSGNASSSSSEHSTGSDVLDSEDDNGFDLPRPIPKPANDV